MAIEGIVMFPRLTLAPPSQGALRVDPADELLTPAQVSTWAKLTLKALANARCRGTGPAFVKLGDGPSAPVRYRRSDVEAWITEGRSGSAA
ncbi:helix-turn-helix transcriptional regulator [Streptomyces shenzhenensis]|uniref:helix-turn-helix transcriptional regulator n=1 Tax=Streptomyces shenzhenensis TaxID=943815 RepID=UPI001F3A9624|nr:helix-turn-helix domain-containing protein [Streptomyces shenzhenensis]